MDLDNLDTEILLAQLRDLEQALDRLEPLSTTELHQISVSALDDCAGIDAETVLRLLKRYRERPREV